MQESSKTGWVYCLVNPTFPTLVKIGATTKHPIERAKELSAPTSVPLPFVLAYHKAVKYPFQVEAQMHDMLDAYRANDSREFFSIPLHQAIEVLDRYEEDRSAFDLGIKTPYADLFATFPDDGVPRNLMEDERAACEDLNRRLTESSCI